MNRRSLTSLCVLLLGLGCPRDIAAQAGDRDATVQGTVRQHESGAPLAGAYVTLMGMAPAQESSYTRITGADGGFEFEAVPQGSYILSARLLGYQELVDTIQVAAGSFTEAMLPLSASAVQLDPVVVVVQRRPVGPLRDFERRRATRTGLFYLREDIEQQAPQEFTDLLRTVSGVRLVPTSTLGLAVRFRGGCEPDLWMDGTLVGSTEDIDDFVKPEHLEALEIYRGADVPGELGSNLCGAIVAWTRRGGRAQEERSIPLQLLYVAGFTLLVVISRW